MNQLLVELLRVNIERAAAASEAIDSISHEGLKGRIRKIFVQDLVAPFLPTSVGVGSGKIIDSENAQSPERDVIIYDRDVMPPLLLGLGEALYPIESVIFAIEVRTRLTLAELGDAHRKAKQIKELRQRPPRCPEGRGYDAYLNIDGGPSRTALVCEVIAFGTDLKGIGKTELRRYDEIHNNEDSSGIPFNTSLCVVCRSHHFSGTVSESAATWHTTNSDSGFEEVLIFLVGLLDSNPENRLNRGNPAWSNYLIQY